MTNLTLVGHFSTALIVAWIVWLLWCAAQVQWYRRATVAADPVIEPTPDVVPEPQPERMVTPRAPGSALRSMTAPKRGRDASRPAPAPPPDAAPPELKPFE